MNSLLKREQCFLKIFLTASNNQKKALVKTMSTSQMTAVVQIVYNVVQGNRNLSESNKNDVNISDDSRSTNRLQCSTRK